MTSVRFTGDSLSTSTLPTQTSAYHMGAWTQIRSGGYSPGGDTAIVAFGTTGGSSQGFQLAVGSGSTDITAIVFRNAAAQIDIETVFTGSSTAWFAWVLQYSGTGSAYTFRYRLENVTTWTTLTLDCGAVLSAGGTLWIGGDQFTGEEVVDGNVKGFWCQATTITDADALAASHNARQGIAPSGTNLHWLDLDSSTNVGVNGGTAGNWTVAGSPATDASTPTEGGSDLTIGPDTPALTDTCEAVPFRIGSVQSTNGDYVTSPTTPLTSPTGNWFFSCWLKHNAGCYVGGDSVSLALTQNPGGQGEGIVIDAGSFSATTLSAIIFSGGGTNLAHNEFLTGSDTAWIHVCVQHVSGSSDYTFRWRKERDTTYHSLTLNLGSQLSLSGGDLVFQIGTDIFNEHSLDSLARQFVCQQTTITDADLLTISHNLDAVPSGTNLHLLTLGSAGNAAINRGTGGAWTSTGTLVSSPLQPNDSTFFSIVPDAASKVQIVPGSTPNLAGAFSVGGEFYFDHDSINGQYEVPVFAGKPTNDYTMFEIYRTPPDDPTPNHLILYYRDNTPTAHEVDLGDAAALYGKWIHYAWTFSTPTSNVGTAHFYAAIEGFTPGSPTYLITPNLGSVINSLFGNQIDTLICGEEKSDSTTTALTVSTARMWATETELTESQISGVGGVWTQRAATSALTSGDYLFLTCDDPTTPGNDTGSPGTDWTQTGTFSRGRSVQPITWNTGSGSLIDVDAGTDTPAVGDALQTSKWFGRALSDTVSVTDSVATGSSQVVSVTASDTASVTDTNFWDLLERADTLSITDSVSVTGSARTFNVVIPSYLSISFAN